MNTTTALHGPLPGQTEWGDAALFTDDAGTVVARMFVAPSYTVPIFILARPDKDEPPQNRTELVARCPLLGEPDRVDYGGWDDPVFRELCEQFGIDPDKQRPTFDPWFKDVGEALLKRAIEAFEAKRYYEHSAAGLAASALSKGPQPHQADLNSIKARSQYIEDETLRENARNALDQLARSADWKEGTQRANDEAVKRTIDEAVASGTPVSIFEDADGPGGTIVFGATADEFRKATGSSMTDRFKRWFSKG